nr:hypothetical protein [uncultured Kingella sp.]
MQSTIFRLQPLQNLQPMAQRFADTFPTNELLLNTLFGGEPPPLHFAFQAAFLI